MELTHASELANLNQLHVLIVDENEFVHQLLQGALLDLGINTVRVCTNSYKALQLCQKTTFNIVLCAFNVKSDKDGFHLLEELKANGHVNKRTVLIFLSSQTDESLVNSIIELQPDDFWSKPLNKAKVVERLTHTLDVKRKLFSIYYAYDHKNYAKAIYFADRFLLDDSLAPYHLNILRLKGQAYLQLREFEEAQVFYQALREKCQHSWVFIGYVHALLKQGKFNDIQDLLAKLTDKPDTRFATYDLLAQHYIDNEQYDLAYEQTKLACELSPRNIERNQKLWHLARLNNDYVGQYQAAKNMVKHAKNSIHDSPRLLLNTIRSALDLISSMAEGTTKTYFGEVNKLIEMITSECEKDTELSQLLWVIKARVHIVQGNEELATRVVDNHFNLKASHDIEDNLDKLKVFQELGMEEEQETILSSIEHQGDNESLNSAVVNQLIKTRFGDDAQKFSARKLNKMAIEYYKKGKLAPALKCLMQARELAPNNAGFAISLLKVVIQLKEKDQHSEEQVAIANQTISDMQIVAMSEKDAKVFEQLHSRWQSQ